MADMRLQIVKWAKFGVANHARFTYSEGGNRMEAIRTKAGTLPITCDCSAFATLCYKWAGAADPNNLKYDGQGYTGTLLAHGIKINVSQALPGDLVVLGPFPGKHVAVIVAAGNDPLTVSMGRQGAPEFVHVSVMRNTIGAATYLRFPTKNINTVISRIVNRFPRLARPTPAGPIL